MGFCEGLELNLKGLENHRELASSDHFSNALSRFVLFVWYHPIPLRKGNGARGDGASLGPNSWPDYLDGVVAGVVAGET